jgi:HAD superfamily hydrolase (TIGR01450 family)
VLKAVNAVVQEGNVIRNIVRAQGWVLDVDGCIVRTAKAGGAGGVPIGGAVELVRWLKDHGRQVVICTNASQKGVSYYAAHLRSMGFDIEDSEFITAATAAASYISEQHSDGPVLVVGDRGLIEALRNAGVPLAVKGGPRPVAVVVGAADQYRSAEISDACLAVADHGAALYVTVDTPWFHGGISKSVSSSTAIACAIQAITGAKPIVCGKPSRAIAQVLSDRLGGDGRDIVVVGDMASIEIVLAGEMGAHGVLVLSGGTKGSDVLTLPENQQPDLCVEDVGSLLAILRGN